LRPAAARRRKKTHREEDLQAAEEDKFPISLKKTQSKKTPFQTDGEFNSEARQ